MQNREHVPHDRRSVVVLLAVAVALITAAAFAFLAIVANKTPVVERALSRAAAPTTKLPGFASEGIVDVNGTPATLPPAARIERDQRDKRTPPVIEYPVVKNPVVEYPVVENPAVGRTRTAERTAERTTERTAKGRVEGAPSAAPAARNSATDPTLWLPERADVQAELGRLRTAIQRCYDRQMVPGRVEVMITVLGETGAVNAVSVRPETGTSACVGAVVRKLELAPFAQPSLTIRRVYYFK